MKVTVKVSEATWVDPPSPKTNVRIGGGKNTFQWTCLEGMIDALAALGIKKQHLKAGTKVTFDLVKANPRRHKYFILVRCKADALNGRTWNEIVFDFGRPAEWEYYPQSCPALLKPLKKDGDPCAQMAVRAVNVKFTKLPEGSSPARTRVRRKGGRS
jgi:hypothetical protein